MSSGHDDSHDDSSAHEHKAFKFTITGGKVTAVFEMEDGVLKPKSIDDDHSETYTVDGSEVVRTEENPFGMERTRYANADGDGLYLRVSEQWFGLMDVTEVGPHFKFEEELSFAPSDGDDHIAVRGGEDSFGGHGADDFVIREAAHLRIEDFHSSEHDSLKFDTGLGLTSVDHLKSFITDAHYEDSDLVVNFGSDVSITLVGVLPGQISWDDVSVLS
ncbi:MAG: hypothetical protein JSR71_02560 [Proteobacteria bacterium]|nr:hypothetical protein [Pseudomonadota bacterium]